jgi:HK97 family phage major capsid protein
VRRAAGADYLLSPAQQLEETKMNLFSMKAERHESLTAADQIVARAESEKRELSTNETKVFDGHMANVKGLDGKIEKIESRNTIYKMVGPEGFFGINNSVSHPKETPKSLHAAMQAATPAELEQVRAFGQYLGGDMTALADLTPSGAGGVFIPTVIAGVVARNYAAFAPVHNAATVWLTNDGEPTTFPVVSDSEVAVILAPAAATGADATVSGDAPPTAITGPLMGAYKFSSKPVFVPRETIGDASLNVVEEILGALLARIIRTQNLKYTKGTGTAEPTGYLHDATAYAAGAVALDLDVALDLAYNVPAMYRPNGIYMATDLTLKYLRKLHTGISGDKRALWKDSFEEGNATLGTPAKLHGYPIIVNNDMDSVATDGTFADVSPLVFGDFKRFIIRDADRGAPFIYRYTVPAKDGSAVIAFQRSDSKLIVPTAISKLTV